ncbi:class I adenylate-forming enzyme family protein [Nocardia sp. NPDC024068]|uniref:class I adenylate-forming enzyme family protein n=1 Tax=Nocardia sp. NPDC024068 TaxID=3157197 RepID=UPI0033D68ABE
MPDQTAATDTIDTLLRRHAAERGHHPAVIDPRTRTTYADLDATTRRIAAALVAAGITKGTRVGLVAPNSVGWVRIALALTRIGAVLVPMSTLLKPPELIAQLRTAAVEVLFASEEFRGHRYLDGLRAILGESIDTVPIHHPELPSLRHIYIAEDVTGLGETPTSSALTRTPRRTRPAHAELAATPAASAVAGALAATVRPADPMLIMFTSGSRGLPKGVIHSHGNALAAVRSGLTARCIDTDTRLYLPMPFFWVGGFGGGILSALTAGATLVTEEIPRPESTLELLERERVTLFRGWPDQAAALARRAAELGTDLSALRPGSLEALLPPGRRSRPGARANLFGMTESFGPYCGYPADRDMPDSAHGSCGRPFEGMEVRIAGPAGEGVPTGTIGEIQLRGPHILRGICRRAREDLFTADGYYPTGDLGRLDEEGFLFYHGRRDDMFKVNGATVYPGEVEKALRSLAGVTGAFVTDVERGAGDRVAAALVVTGRPDIGRLCHAAREILSSFKVPTIWLLLDSDTDIPRGTTGKVDIAALRKLLSDRGIDPDTATGPPR